MALTEYVGLATLDVDSREVEIASYSVTDMTGRKPVKTMNRTGRIKGFTRGLGQFEIKATAVIPKGGTPINWANIEGAKLTIEPLGGGKRISYLDCFTTQVGEQYDTENEAKIDISLIAIRKVEE